MEIITINDYNLDDKDIGVFSNKVRALLVDGNNNFLIGNYGGVYLLPVIILMNWNILLV